MLKHNVLKNSKNLKPNFVDSSRSVVYIRVKVGLDVHELCWKDGTGLFSIYKIWEQKRDLKIQTSVEFM